MLTIKEEYDQWLVNYEILLNQLRASYRFKNIQRIEEINKRILNTQVQIAICALRLKKEGNSDPKSPVGAPVSGDVKVRKHAPVDLKGIHWVWPE